MAITTLIAGGTSDANRTVFVFDALTNKEVEWNNDITKHPVESGSDITDNVVNKNDTISVVGYISNTPVEGMIDSISQNREVEEAGNRVQQAYDLFKELRQSKRPFTIVTELDTYPNCLISSLAFPEEGGKSNLDVLEVKMELEQVRIVSAEGIFVSNVAPAQKDDSKDTTSEGTGEVVAAPPTSSFLRTLEAGTAGE